MLYKYFIIIIIIIIIIIMSEWNKNLVFSNELIKVEFITTMNGLESWSFEC